MKQLRNVAIVGHSGGGKTSLSEALLYKSGAIDKMGEVAGGTTTTDYSPDEVKRQMTIDSAVFFVDWRDNKLNFVDTPGYADFTGEVRNSMKGYDAALIVLDAGGNVQIGAERAWQYARAYKMRPIIFINKIDESGVDWKGLLERIRKRWGKEIMPMQMPLADSSGVLDVVDFKKDAAPSDIAAEAGELHEKLMEAAAETDDKLTEKYLEEGGLSPDEFKGGLRDAIISGKLVPVFFGSALKNIGVESLLDGIINYCPSPSEGVMADELKGASEGSRCAYVFKTVSEPHLGTVTLFRVYSGQFLPGVEVYNSARKSSEKIGQLFSLRGHSRIEIDEVAQGDIGVTSKLKATKTGDTLCDKKTPVILPAPHMPEAVFSIAVKPAAKKDQEKLGACVAKLIDEDPSLNMRMDKEFGQTILSGMGEVHLDIAVGRLRDRFGVDVEIEETKVPYRETIRAKSRAQGKYKKQSGGRGQYGDAWLAVEPLPSEKNFEFVNAIVGGAIPAKYIPAVEKGVKEAMQRGVLAGFPMTSIRVKLDDGTFHQVDSSDMAFQIAGSMAFKKATADARPVLLEPVVQIEIDIPEAYLGDVTSDLSGRRGRIMTIEPGDFSQRVKAAVPLAEAGRYATDLKSMTQGEGSCTMSFLRYEEVPSHVSEKIIAEAKKEEE